MICVYTTNYSMSQLIYDIVFISFSLSSLQVVELIDDIVEATRNEKHLNYSHRTQSILTCADPFWTAIYKIEKKKFNKL